MYINGVILWRYLHFLMINEINIFLYVLRNLVFSSVCLSSLIFLWILICSSSLYIHLSCQCLPFHDFIFSDVFNEQKSFPFCYSFYQFSFMTKEVLRNLSIFRGFEDILLSNLSVILPFSLDLHFTWNVFVYNVKYKVHFTYSKISLFYMIIQLPCHNLLIAKNILPHCSEVPPLSRVTSSSQFSWNFPDFRTESSVFGTGLSHKPTRIDHHLSCQQTCGHINMGLFLQSLLWKE